MFVFAFPRLSLKSLMPSIISNQIARSRESTRKSRLNVFFDGTRGIFFIIPNSRLGFLAVKIVS